jgi:transposase-like protein
MKEKSGPTAYSDEFCREAVRLVESGRADLVQVAKDLGVHPQSLRTWCRTAARQCAGTSTPTRVLLEEENRRLRRENGLGINEPVTSRVKLLTCTSLRSMIPS